MLCAVARRFIGEESWAAGEETRLGSEPHWIVDPIDGTTNFTRGLPACCISIGITYQTRPVIGVIYAPFTGYLYWASEGHGAWLETPSHPNKRQLPLSKPLPLPSLRQAVMGAEWGSDRRAETVNKKMASFVRLAGDPDAGVDGGQMVSGIRSLGSAALSCCAVAEGALDLWHEIGCWVSWCACVRGGCLLTGSTMVAVMGRLRRRRHCPRGGGNRGGIQTEHPLFARLVRFVCKGDARCASGPQVPGRPKYRRLQRRVGQGGSEAHRKDILRGY